MTTDQELRAELLILRAERDQSDRNAKELVKAEEMYRANEQHMLRKLSRILTGGNAGTWDEIEHAAEALAAQLTEVRALLTEMDE